MESQDDMTQHHGPRQIMRTTVRGSHILWQLYIVAAWCVRLLSRLIEFLMVYRPWR